jgi:hypothetical protein
MSDKAITMLIALCIVLGAACLAVAIVAIATLLGCAAALNANDCLSYIALGLSLISCGICIWAARRMRRR